MEDAGDETRTSLRPLRLRGPCRSRTSGRRGAASSARGSWDTPTASAWRASRARAGWPCASCECRRFGLGMMFLFPVLSSSSQFSAKPALCGTENWELENLFSLIQLSRISFSADQRGSSTSSTQEHCLHSNSCRSADTSPCNLRGKSSSAAAPAAPARAAASSSNNPSPW
jgi:hypothetical protein